MAQLLAKEDRYLSDFQAFERGLPADDPAWVRQLRRQALARFTELGFPTARRGNEAWKYTNVGPIAKVPFAYPFDPSADGASAPELRRLAPWDDGWVNLVFMNGRYTGALSTPAPQANGARVMNLADALVAHPDLLEEHLSQHASFEADGFTDLNTAFLRDGAFIHVPDGQQLPAPVHLIFLTTEGAQPTASHPRVLLVAGRHSRVTLIESYGGLSRAPYLTNAVAEMVAGEGAHIEHYRFLMESPQAFHVGSTRVRLDRDSAFSSTCFATGCAVARNDLHVLLDVPGSSCVLKGLYVTTDTQHIDNHIGVDHAKPHTTSRLYYKGILDGHSRAVFSGRVLVRPDAQKTDARQDDRNLILSEGAEVDSKPSLEIFADDVRCFHGATSGRLDEDALFYVRSRGLDQETARSLLVHAFASEIIDAVPLEPLRVHMEGLLSGALTGPGATP